MHERTVRARTATGIVEGFTRDGVHRWRSIPYARAPVGSLRFRAPQPAQPWPGVRHCHTFANCAPQQRRYTVMGIGRYQTRSEDCLTLNVVTPEEPATQPLPVMVFIHGGGYILGSSATPIYDGAALARRGCVYVSVNYRLGALGCLDLSSLSTPQITLDSNVYLRDLVLALRWVHDNIAEFGGDPGNVTIFGESAGAHITATLLAVPAAKGLFARAISESPAAGMVRSREVAAEFAARFANLIGARTQDAANALMQASPAQLVEAQHHLIRQGMRKRLGAFPIGPVFGDDYLPMDPVEAMRSGRVHAVPLIVGTNAEEGRLFTRFLGMLPTNEPMVEELLSGMKPADRERITAAYPNYPAPSACIQLGGDFAFSSAAWQIAEAHGANAPTYLYRYDYAPRTLRWSGFGATHATELFAVFDIYRTRFGALLTAAADRRAALRVSNEVQRRWRCFSQIGVPGDDWPAYTQDDRAVLVFDRRCRIEFDPHQHRRIAWDGFSLAKVAKIGKAEIRARVLAAAKLLDLQSYLDRKPKDLSGGQRQRVAMGRAIVRRPQVFLMDEPLSNLDAKLRGQTRNQIAALQRQLGTTTVYVTHDQVEAMTMGDRVAVLSDGVLQQCASPRELYRNPGNVFVAGFIGSPAMNLFRLSIADSTVSLGDWQILLPRAVVGTAAEVIIGVRPEHLELGGAGIEMDVDMVEELGADAYLYGRIVSGGCEMDQSIVARVDGRGPPERGSRVRLCPTPGHLHFFAVDGRRIPG